ncbi:MAG: hypothetical protein KC983_08730, partial [Phycisphaerales bacterium]|nr:hypothetical protein [Phycisphaerales bacterium]
MGLHVGGVDMLEGADGPQIMEVNSSPGLEGIETATGVDVAGAIVDHLVALQRFPEVDLRQRLSLGAGYAVSEFVIVPGSSLANQTLAEAQLRERDIIVLNITRGGVTFPNPGGEHQILIGDTLLCYGKVLSLRSLIPDKPSRTRKKKDTKKASGSVKQ